LGPISNNKIFVREPIASNTGILLTGGTIQNNEIEGVFTHICNNLLVVNTGSYNTIKALVTPNGVTGTTPIGANLAGGEQNTYYLTWPETFAAGQSLIFGANARDNVVYASNLAANGITNNATWPTNRVIPLGRIGYGVGTPAFPSSGQPLKNVSSYTVAATIATAGVVTQWQLSDAAGTTQTVNAGLYPGQEIFLEPGETVTFTHTGAATWNWRTIR
jgi:hypothetical protein